MTNVDFWEAVADRHGLLSTGDALAAGVAKRDLAEMVKDAAARLVLLRSRCDAPGSARAAARAVSGRAFAAITVPWC